MRSTALHFIFGLGAVVFGAAQARAETMSCRAHVALNRIYDVQLDLASGALVVVNDAGSRAEGVASHWTSGTDGNNAYFLPTGFGTGMEIDLESSGQNRIALCLAQNECYLCR